MTGPTASRLHLRLIFVFELISMRIIFLLAFISIIAVHAAPSISVTQNASSVARYDVYELTITNTDAYTNPWTDASIACVFKAPSAQQISVAGFYYDTNTWKCRFAPRETGAYSWTLSFAAPSGSASTSGSFTATASNRTGFLKRHPSNPYALITEADNRLFFGIGVENLYDQNNGDGIAYLSFSFSETANPSWQLVPADTYFSQYSSGAGANFYRSNGESPPAHELNDLNGSSSGAGKFTTRLDYGRVLDNLLQAAHKYDFHVVWTPIYDPSHYGVPNWDLSNSNLRSAFLAYWRYVVARYGAYVDIWELGNEVDVPDSFVNIVGGDIQAHDPYGHMLSIGGGSSSAFRGSANPLISINGPHFYWNVPTVDLDDQFVNSPYGIANVKSNFANKPFYWGESGNVCPLGDNSDFTRIRTFEWVGLLNQVSGLVFWNNDVNASCGSSTGVVNFYFGPTVRSYSKVFANYIQDFDPTAVPTPLTVSANVRGYAMASGSDLGAYFLHTTSRTTPISGATVTLTVPASGLNGQWIDPATGNVISSFSPAPGRQTLTIPTFTADIALRIKGTASAPATSRCDLNSDGQVDSSDVQVALDQALGKTTCGSADLVGSGVCTVVDVQRVINASFGAACKVGP